MHGLNGADASLAAQPFPLEGVHDASTCEEGAPSLEKVDDALTDTEGAPPLVGPPPLVDVAACASEAGAWEWRLWR